MRGNVLAILSGILTAAQASTGEPIEIPLAGKNALQHILWPDSVNWEEQDSRKLLRLETSQDPYVENAWEIWLPGGDFADGMVVEVEFADIGAGVITATSDGAAAVRQCSYTRCNTHRDRRAAFEFKTAPPAGATLKMTGLQYPLAIRVLPRQDEPYWKALADSRPKKVHPLVSMKRPMRLATTTGIDVVGGMDTLDASLEQMAELAPLAKALGMTSIEGYVTWKRLEPEREGEFDFSFYDPIVQKLAEYDLKFFPLLIVGSAYALPDWFIESPDNIGFVCLEHGIENPVQSIWAPTHRRHVERVLKAFGDHYSATGVLEAVRLGPSGNYGESQYPAGGNWGAKGRDMHIHIGWWTGDRFGRQDFRRFLLGKYPNLELLNTAWGTSLASFEEADCATPVTMLSRRQRADFTQWYTDSMSDWCAWWGQVTRDALPDTPIYQSAGGWGFREAGTEYSVQAEGMVPIGGGIRLTNETDSYEQNVYATRLGATAAKLYGMPLGYEPASSHTARGVVGRIFNTLTTNGDHLFTYHSNLLMSQLAIDKWVEYVPLFDTRQPPMVEVAVYYPETANQLDDAAFRHLYAWGFNPRAAAVRRVVEVDYLDDHLIREGFLDKYKVLVCVWGDTVEKDVQEKMDAWLRAGGAIIYHHYPRGPMIDLDGNNTIFTKWAAGDTGKGKFMRFKGDMEPPEIFSGFVKDQLLSLESLHPWTRTAITAERPSQVFLTVQQDGTLLAMNYTEAEVNITLADGREMPVGGYAISSLPLVGSP